MCLLRNNTELSKHLWGGTKERLRNLLENSSQGQILFSPNVVTYVIPRNSTFYINRTWQRLTGVMSLNQLAGKGLSFSLNSIASSMTNHKLTNVYYYCCLSLNFVTIMLPMYLNPSDYSVYGI